MERSLTVSLCLLSLFVALERCPALADEAAPVDDAASAAAGTDDKELEIARTVKAKPKSDSAPNKVEPPAPEPSPTPFVPEWLPADALGKKEPEDPDFKFSMEPEPEPEPPPPSEADKKGTDYRKWNPPITFDSTGASGGDGDGDSYDPSAAKKGPSVTWE